MKTTMKRGAFAAGTLAAAYSLGAVADARDVDLKLAQIEGATNGRLGVAVFDAHGVQRVSYRPGERFIMCSTFKLLAAADALTQVDAGALSLEHRVHYTKADLLDYAPAAKQHVGRGWMTVREIFAAVIELSDNTAANLLVKSVGGPADVTRYLRSIGDRFTRLDRLEPQLNRPSGILDTTTPESMGFDACRLLLQRKLLSANSRALLTDWLRRSTTGLDLLRAGFPPTWRVGDKTGMGGGHTPSGDSDTRNDVAVVWPPGRSPFVAAVYLTGVSVSAQQRDAALADVARVIAPIFS